METYILGLESSCDETSAAVLMNKNELLSNVVAAQPEIHNRFGGVVPEIAARKHVEMINPVIDQALKEAGIKFKDLSAVAVTYGPGLAGGLLVALSAAKSVAFACDLPLIAVNHIEGHIAANFLEYSTLKPPFVSLTVSGGHTDLVYIEDLGSYKFLGRTRDDAAGEAFDKVARILGLGYPGGPEIDRIATNGDPEAVEFPRAYLDGNYDFSFSGLKTAVKNFYRNEKNKENPLKSADIAASFQQAVVDVLVDKTLDAALDEGVGQVLVSGGVASNSALRRDLKNRASEYEIEICIPHPKLCTDNAAMIAVAGYFKYLQKDFAGLDLSIYPNLKLGEKRY